MMSKQIGRCTRVGTIGRGIGLALLVAVAGQFLVAHAQAQRRDVPNSREMVQYSFAPVVRKTAPAVVNVYVSSRVRDILVALRG